MSVSAATWPLPQRGFAILQPRSHEGIWGAQLARSLLPWLGPGAEQVEEVRPVLVTALLRLTFPTSRHARQILWPRKVAGWAIPHDHASALTLVMPRRLLDRAFFNHWPVHGQSALPPARSRDWRCRLEVTASLKQDSGLLRRIAPGLLRRHGRRSRTGCKGSPCSALSPLSVVASHGRRDGEVRRVESPHRNVDKE